jgi:hypothetical protein
MAYELSVFQLVNVSGLCSPDAVVGPESEDVTVVERDFPDFRTLRFASCGMVNNVPNQSRYGEEKTDQSDDVDTSKREQETPGDCQRQMS